MIDIHTHILPGIDDGARSLHEAYEMALMAVRSGVQALVATPHSNDTMGYVNYDSDRQKTLFESLKEILQEEKVPLQIYRGMENLASVDIPEKIICKKLLTLNQSRYVLVEFAFDEETWWIEVVLREIRKAGFVPVIAHPERYGCVQDDPNCLYEWRVQGALAQMNKGSILGRFGSCAARAAETLLKHHLFTCIASDAHGARIRTTDMSEINRYIQRFYSMREQHLLLRENPLTILQDGTIKNQKEMLPIV